jgi:hypothetical protein
MNQMKENPLSHVLLAQAKTVQNFDIAQQLHRLGQTFDLYKFISLKLQHMQNGSDFMPPNVPYI